MQNKKILICGSYGAGNIGDEAMLSVILKKLSKENEVWVLSGNPEDTKKRHGVLAFQHFPFGVRSFLSFSWVQSFQKLLESDVVILGGGGLFTDDYTIKAVFLWAWQAFFFIVTQKPFFIFAQSVGPLHSQFSQILSKWVFSHAETIIVRDAISAECVKTLLPEKEVFVGTDIVFDFPVSVQKAKKKLVAINLRDWDMDFSCLPKFLESLRKDDFEIIGIATEEDDKKLLHSVLKINEKLLLPKDFSEMLRILETCEYTIGMRLHFLIAGILSGAKIGGISYSKKVTGILEKFQLPFVLPEDVNEESLKTLFVQAKRAEEEILEEEQKKVDEMFDKLV